jgi:thiol-disulfide isomerase/thioredoxin
VTSWRRVGLIGAALFCCALTRESPAATPAVHLARPGSDVPVDLATVRGGRPSVLLFWRTDCAPCLLELRNLSQLTRAARPGRLVLIALQPRDELARGLRRLGPVQTWRAMEDPVRVLVRFGGKPPSLPLAVALDPKGKVCRVRHGLLGRNIVAEWIKACE